MLRSQSRVLQVAMLNEDSRGRASEREVLFGQNQKELPKTDMSRVKSSFVPHKREKEVF